MSGKTIVNRQSSIVNPKTMAREAYCNTSYDLEKWLPFLHRLAANEEIQGTNGIFPSGARSFTDASAVFTVCEANDTLIIPEGEYNAGVYHIASVVSNSITVLSRTSVRSATGLTWGATKLFNRIAQDASDSVDESLADLAAIVAVPFDRLLFQGSLSAVGRLDEDIPHSLAGYLLDFTLAASSYPIGFTVSGYGDWRDWRQAGVDVVFSSDPTPRPTTEPKAQTESLTFSAAGTQTTAKKWREVTGITATTGTGTLTVRLNVPRQIKRLAALEASIQLMQGNYLRGSSNTSEWLESLKAERKQMYDDYRSGVRKVAELTESTHQRGRARAVRVSRA